MVFQIWTSDLGLADCRTCDSNEEEWELFKSEFCKLLLKDMTAYFPDEAEAEERSKYLSFPFWGDLHSMVQLHLSFVCITSRFKP